MRFDLLKEDDWERFNLAFPIAKAFLQELALRRELEELEERVSTGVNISVGERLRLHELQVWRDAVDKTRSTSNG